MKIQRFFFGGKPFRVATNSSASLHIPARMTGVLFILVTLAACGGGGGGDGVGDGPAGRSTSTGLRILHSSIDESPVTASIDGVAVQTKGYLELSHFSKVERGSRTLSVKRANSVSEDLLNVTQQFDDATEYTLFVWGEGLRRERRITLLAEAIERPEEGAAKIRFANGYAGDGMFRLRCRTAASDPVTSTTVRQGNITEYLTITSGPQDCEVLSSSGSRAATVSLEAADRSDLTVVFAGSDELGIRFVRVFTDLD